MGGDIPHPDNIRTSH